MSQLAEIQSPPVQPGGDGRNEPALRLERVSKAYNGIHAIQDVTFTVGKNRVIGLVGENGAGKSTIISIINGTVAPDNGAVAIHGRPARFGHPDHATRMGVATVFQEQGLVPQLKVYENMFLGREAKYSTNGILRQRAMIAEAKAVLDELGVGDINPEEITSNLDFGKRQLVEIAKAFLLARVYPVEPVILLDEPTSALSAAESKKLFDGMERWRQKASLVLVSHSMSDIFRICDEVVALKDGRVVAQMAIGETSEEALHELIVGRKREEEYYKEFCQREAGDKVVLSVRQLTKDAAFSDITFDIREGEILGVAGVLGSGKSVLASCLAGLTVRNSGTVTLNEKNLRSGNSHEAIANGIGYVPAERNLAGIIGAHSVEWNLTLPGIDQIMTGRGTVISPRKSASLTEKWLRKLNVRCPGRHALARHLSGGNQQKIVFAKWLSKGIDVLILDEPGRGLDVGAKEEIYQLMRDIAAEGAAVMLISDNLPELIGLSNRILVLRGGKITAEFNAPPSAKPEESAIIKYMI